MIGRCSARFGWRGLWLLVVGIAYLALGLGAMLEQNADAAWVPLQQLPPALIAVLWWASGAVAIGVGWRGPDVDDSLGHVALYLMPAAKWVSFAVAWLVSLASPFLMDAGLTEAPIGNPAAWYAAGIWVTFSMMLAVTAGWPNPAPPVVAPPTGRL